MVCWKGNGNVEAAEVERESDREMVEVGCCGCSSCRAVFVASPQHTAGSYKELQRVVQRSKREGRGSGSDSEHERLHRGEEENVNVLGRLQQSGW